MTKQNSNIIGKRIRQAREDVRPRMTQDDLGRKLGYKDGAYISRWESGDRIPGTKSLQKLAEIFEKPPTWFYSDGLTTPNEGIKLPSLINIIRYELDVANQRMALTTKRTRILEVPVMVINTSVPKPFLIPTDRTIQIPQSILEAFNELDIEDITAIEIVTELGNEFDIHIGDNVFLKKDPERIDGALYLITYQGIMSFRNITWRPPTLIDARGNKTPFKEKYLEMSGQVLVTINIKQPKFYKPQP